MNLIEFITVCESGESSWPVDWHPLQRALALDWVGEWDAAHSIVQKDTSRQSSAIHAYLHRKEKAEWNAKYWYRQAGRPPFAGTLREEWRALAAEFLD